METELNHLTASMAALESENNKLRAELAELRAREVSAAFKSGDVTRANAALRAATDGHLGVKPAAVPDDITHCSNCKRHLTFTSPGNGSCHPMCDRPTVVFTPVPMNRHTRTLAGDKQPAVPDDVAKDAEVGAAIHRACCELPEGFTIHIDLENGAGSVEMMWEDERWEPDFDLSFAGQISECVDEAIRSTDEDAAILAAKEKGQ